MSVSLALEKSASAFCLKYACNFDFEVFEAGVEEFTLLSSSNGWMNLYKRMFERMYFQALESLVTSGNSKLDSEGMLDDFEYTLIRPYVNEVAKAIKHNPYVGMDRLSRLEYLQALINRSPSNSVALYAKKYKSGELSIKHIRSRIKIGEEKREHYVEMAVFLQALEAVNRSRSLPWRLLHPFKNNAEKRLSKQLKKSFTEGEWGSEEIYNQATLQAYQTFGEHQMITADLKERMIHAREELNIKKKMSDAKKFVM